MYLHVGVSQSRPDTHRALPSPFQPLPPWRALTSSLKKKKLFFPFFSSFFFFLFFLFYCLFLFPAFSPPSGWGKSRVSDFKREGSFCIALTAGAQPNRRLLPAPTAGHPVCWATPGCSWRAQQCPLPPQPESLPAEDIVLPIHPSTHSLVWVLWVSPK